MQDRQRPALTLDQTRERIRTLALRIRRAGVVTTDDVEQVARALLHFCALQGLSAEDLGATHLEPFATILRAQSQPPARLHA